MITANQIKVWKTIKLGTQDVNALRKAVMNAGCNHGSWGNDILVTSNFTVEPKEIGVELVLITVAEMGFNDGATFSDICTEANKLDLDLCPAEVGPQLFLQYTDQPLGERILVAMKPIKVGRDLFSIFDVAHFSNGRRLNGSYGQADIFYSNGYQFVFVRRK